MASNDCHVCVPLVAPTVEGQLSQMKEAKEAGVDIVEIRIDYLKDFVLDRDLPALLNGRILPAIVTHRPSWEGGQYKGDENERLEVLRRSIELKADFIDVELQVAYEFIASLPSNAREVTLNEKTGKYINPTQIIVSNHNYESTPPIGELTDLILQIKSTGADIVKIATTANDICDVARVFKLMNRMQTPIIFLVMGPKGEISRFLAPKFGGFLTFAKLGAGQDTAPGQPTVNDLVNVYKIKRINRDTKIYGVIANPVGHSKSPLLFNNCFSSLDFNGVYVPLLVDDVKRFFTTFNSPDFAGFSVTLPHKQTALQCCQEVDEVSKAIGAVNNIIQKEDGSYSARNTDWNAAVAAIEQGITKKEGSGMGSSSPLENRLLVVVGAGGSGRALAFGAKKAKARLLIADQDNARAKELASVWGEATTTIEELQVPGVAFSLVERFASDLPKLPPILAHMTPVGMQPNVNSSLFTSEMLEGYSVVFDAVYTPSDTLLLENATKSGCLSVSGIEMFIRQASEQFEMFTKLPPPIDLMRKIMGC